MKLYEICQELQTLIAQVEVTAEEAEGEIPEDLCDQLESLQMAKEDKVHNIALLIKNNLAEAEVIKKEEKSLAARRKRAEGIAESAKNYLSTFCKGEKYSWSNAAISWRGSESVEVPDVSLLPEEYQRKKVVIDPDKVALKPLLKLGQQIPGATLIQKQNIQIK